MARPVPALPASVVVYAHTARGGGGSARSAAKKGRRQATLGASAGVVVVPHRVGSKAVSREEVNQAVEALRRLPATDIALIASRGIQVHLYPTGGLEGGLLGATTIVQDEAGGAWSPTRIRIAARAGLDGAQSLGEIVQHEFGHAVSVIKSQDRTEDAAHAYARTY